MADLATAELMPPRFAIERLLPRRFVTLLAGHGDSGKTLLALTFAAHIACGRRFADLACTSGRVLFVSLEDDGALVKLRLRRIADAYELDPADVGAGITLLTAGDTDDCALATEQAEHGVRRLAFTPALKEIRAAAVAHDVVMIDNASDAYDANENERRLVRSFVRALQRIARDCDAAVLLLAHIDKWGAKQGTNGESYSGSTAWHNSVRSRLALAASGAGLELVHEKANLCAKLERGIELERGEHGVLFPLSRAERAQKGREDERAVLDAIRAVTAAGLTVPTAVSGPATAVHALAGRPEIPENLATDNKRLRAALSALERQGAIERESYQGPNRHSRERYRCASSIGA
jgi:KaiC/GvpD/RAD55 family RecA-like ATPase